MDSFFDARVAYGRTIRERALCLLDAHGPMAETEARCAANEPGITDAERHFLEAVAARVARLTGTDRRSAA